MRFAPAGLFYSMASLSPIGTVVDLATHPALADGGNRLLSSDLPLIARRVSHERRGFFCVTKKSL